MFGNDSQFSKAMESTMISSNLEGQFGPWAVFDLAWKSIKGYHAEDFEFVTGKTPLSTLQETLGFILVYYITIFGGREFMRDRKAFKLNGLFMAHNFLLSTGSAALLLLFAGQLLPTLISKGLYANICGSEGWTKPLVTLYYLNYVFKYIELLDTVFLVLKKKPLTFLHCYHHPATVLLCYTQLIGKTSVSWVPITLNLFVHVVMYWYYFQSARGVRVAWKQWITRFQISQFVLDLGFVYFASWDYFTSTYWPSLPHVGTCAGHPWAAIAGDTILSSYLVLFILFYLATYKSKKGTKTHKKSASKAISDLKKTDVSNMANTVARAAEAIPKI